MNKAYHLFTLFNIPVAASPMFPLLIFILALNIGDVIRTIVFACVCVLALLTHEFGHALVAKKYKLKPQVILTGLGGLTQHASANAKQSFRITLAGPSAGLLVAAISFCALVALAFAPQTFVASDGGQLLALFLTDLFQINLVWSIFNFLPIYPMDGGKLLAAILAKFCKPQKAIKIGLVTSIIFCVALMLYFVISKNLFMIFIALYLMIINISGARQAFSTRENLIQEKASLRAEAIYEMGVASAREHRWKELEMYGHQMKEAATTPDQLERAYEFLTIACTNTFQYKEALEYSKRASQTDAVKQAVVRCNRILEEKTLNEG